MYLALTVAMWLPLLQASETRGRAKGDASMFFSPTCAFCKEAEAFSETTLTTSSQVSLVSTEATGCKVGQESEYLFARLFVFPRFCSGRQTGEGVLGTTVGSRSFPAGCQCTGHRAEIVTLRAAWAGCSWPPAHPQLTSHASQTV